MNSRIHLTALAVLSVLFSVSSFAQSADFDVLVDTDRNAANGCSVTPSGGATLDGFEHRIRASVDLASFEVVALTQSSCDGGGFGAPIAIPGFSVPYPLALNTGTGGADAVELAVARAALGATNLSQLRLTFLTDNGAGSDVLASADGAGGGPIMLGLPVQIPVLSLWGLGALVLVLLGLAWMAHRRMGRVGAVMAVMLVTSAAWAMTFALDGDLGDWGGRAPNATDPGGDATDGSAAIDLVAGFVVLDGNDLFFRMDVSDTENQAPEAAADAFSTDEDAPLSVAAPGVLSNDSDGDGDPITAVIATGPANAQVFVLNPDGSFDYTPNADFNGSDSFTYFANDGQADSVPATVTITVNAVNDPPLAVDDAATTNEDQQVDIDVLANDSDVDGNLDPSTVTVTGAPASGATAVDPTTGVITYTKSGDFNGVDSFDYQVCDDGAPTPVECATATVTITVDPVNDAPAADAGTATTDEDVPVVITLTGSDIDGDALTFAVATGPTNGALGAIAQATPTSANVTYTPNADFNGADSFTFTVNDGTVSSPAATVSITVAPVNDSPVAAGDAFTVDEDSIGNNLDVLANDTDVEGDAFTVGTITQPANGSVAITGGGTGVTYTPNADYCNAPPGTALDTFTYALSPGGSSTTVTVTVTCFDDAPVAVADAATVAEGSVANAIDVLANDTDPDGGPISIASITQPANGAASITGGGTGVSYTPNADYCNAPPGTTLDTFTYALSPGGSSTTVTVSVTCVDDPPTAVADAATVTEDSGANAIDVLANDTDIDGGPISVASVTQPANGSVAITGGGAGVSYTPNANYCNSPPGTTLDTFTYTLTPGGSSTSVTVTVTCVDDGPVAVADAATVMEDSGANPVDVLANDTDVDGGAISITSVTQPANGSVAITGGGTGVSYTPNANYCNSPPGTTLDTFTYTLTPGGSSTSVTVTVTCVDDDPAAVADAATVMEDSGANPVDVLANDTDVDGGPISIASITQPANGAASITGGGTGVSYTPDANYCNNPPGTTLDTFTYTLTPGGSSTTVTVTVTCVDDPPTAVADGATVGEDSGANVIAVLANDTDIDGGPISVVSVTQPVNGSVAVTGGGTGLSYAPSADYCNNQPGGTADTFSYTLNGGSAATVAVTVNCVNDPPVAAAKLHVTHSGIGLTIAAASHVGELKEGATDVDNTFAELSVELVGTPTPANATVTLLSAADGSFFFEPPGGLSGNGAASFQFRVCDDGDAGLGLPPACSAAVTATFNITGPDLWFVDDTDAAGCAADCNGSSSKPLVGLAGLPAIATRGTGDRIFAFAGTYASGHAFAGSERLIGQGATGSTFDALLGVQVPVNGMLDARPTVAGARPVVQGQVTLANGVTAQGFNIIPPTGTQGLFGSGVFTGISVSQMNVATTGATAVSLTSLTGDFAFNRIDANGGASGIVLNGANAASGSFIVLGDGSDARNGSGGTIRNATGSGLSLANTSGISLSSMVIENNTGSGVAGTNVTGFDLIGTRVLGNASVTGGTQAGLRFDGLLGNASIIDSEIAGSIEDNIRITATTGTLANLAISNSTIGPNDATFGGSGLALVGIGTAAMTVNVTDSTFIQNRASGILTSFANDASHTVNVATSSFIDNNTAIDLGTDGNADMAFLVNGNSAVGSTANAINIVTGTGATNGALVRGTVNNNAIGNGTPDSGSQNAFGIAVDLRGDVDAVLQITNNTVRNTDIDGIFIQSRLDNDGDAEIGLIDVTLTDNAVSAPDDNSAFPFGFVYGTRIESRNTSNLCLDIQNNSSAGVGGAEGFRTRQRDTSTFRAERLALGAQTAAAMQTFVAAQNDAGSTANATANTSYTGVADGSCRAP